jgi:putative hydrolase of the HAD superfamily
MRPRPLFFDLDHTLWDFETNSRLALGLGHETMGLAGLGVASVEAWIASYERANDWCWAEFRAGRMDKATLRAERFRLAFKGLGVPAETQICERLGEHYIETSPMQTSLIEGTLEVLEVLKDRGHHMVILTNGFEEVQHIKVDNSGLSGFFSGVYTSDFLGVKKPNPKAFEFAAEAAGIAMNAGIVMIGDSIESDIDGAQSVGWDAVHFNPDGPLHNDAWQSIRHLRELLELPLDG